MSKWMGYPTLNQTSAGHILVFHLSYENTAPYVCLKPQVFSSVPVYRQPRFLMVPLTIIWLYNGAKVIHSQWKVYLSFEFWSFPGLARCGNSLSPAAGQRQGAAAPSWLPSQGSTTDTLRSILLFTFSTVFKELHEVFNTMLENQFDVRRFCPTVGLC